jgi:hypothetical protein
MSDEDAMGLIEDIITCVNALVSSGKQGSDDLQAHLIYIRAYKELAIYLKHLFIHYDRKIGQFPDTCINSAWCRFLRHAADSDEYSGITVVTYNYDVWLERLLVQCKVPFNIGVVGRCVKDRKINILKPHGSISFAHKQCMPRDAFRISYKRELLDGQPKDFRVQYKDLDDNYAVSALIPPAGESSRFNHTWAGAIRARAKGIVATLAPEDELLISGLSYWHVDRGELDEILVSCNPQVNVKMINPKPPRALNAVLSSIFDNYITYTSSDILEEFVPCPTS